MKWKKLAKRRKSDYDEIVEICRSLIDDIRAFATSDNEYEIAMLKHKYRGRWTDTMTEKISFGESTTT